MKKQTAKDKAFMEKAATLFVNTSKTKGECPGCGEPIGPGEAHLTLTRRKHDDAEEQGFSA